MTVTSLDNIRGSKSLVIEQQDEEDNSTANAVSFPASVLKQNSSTGKTWKQLLDLSMITTTALSKKGQRRGDTVCRLCIGAALRSWLMLVLWFMAFTINSISNWVNFPAGGGGGIPYDGLYREAPPERGIFFRLQVYQRVGISLIEVHKKVGKCRLGLWKGPKGLTD